MQGRDGILGESQSDIGRLMKTIHFRRCKYCRNPHQIKKRPKKKIVKCTKCGRDSFEHFTQG